MRVDTFLRKEKEGTLYKEGEGLDEVVEEVNRRVSEPVGLNVKNLLQRRTIGPEILNKMRHELEGLKLGAAHKDEVPGGKADDKQPSDFDATNLNRGIKVEREHTDSSTLAKEIAMDHLTEFPNYYDALDKMEKELEEKKLSGVLGDLGRVLTTPIPGTKDWLLRSANPVLKKTKGLAARMRSRGTSTAGGVTTLGPGYEKYLPKMAAGQMENKLPWYTTAGLGAAGGLAGNALLPGKLKALGTVGGTLLGTGLGLEGGTALGKRLDERAALRKQADSGGTMQRMTGEGASRGIDTYIMQDFGLGGKPATAKHKPGDAPSRDQAPGAKYPAVEHGTTIMSLDQAPKVAGALPLNAPPLPLKRLVALAGGGGRQVAGAVKAAPRRAPALPAVRGYGPNPTAPIIAQPGTLAAKKQTKYLQQRLQSVAGGEAAPGAKGSVEWAERGGGYARNAGLNSAEFANLSPQAQSAIRAAADKASANMPNARMAPEQAYALIAGSGHGRGGTQELVRAATTGIGPRSASGVRTAAHGLESARTVPVTGVGLPRAEMATKVGGIAANEMEFPTRDESPERDQAEVHRREMHQTQWAGADTPVPGYNPNWQKKAHLQLAMRDELAKLCCVKLADYRDANEALQKLKALEETKPTPAEVSRAAIAGAGVGSLSAAANSLVSGGGAKALREGIGEVRKLHGLPVAAKLTRGQALRGIGTGLKTVARNQAGAAAGSAVFGATLPFAKRYLDRRAETGKIREYLEGQPRSRLRRAASQYIGA
jgi:hypothetical protein